MPVCSNITCALPLVWTPELVPEKPPAPPHWIFSLDVKEILVLWEWPVTMNIT